MADFNPAMLSRQQLMPGADAQRTPGSGSIGPRSGMWGASTPSVGPQSATAAAPWENGVVMPDEDATSAPWGRTDFTQEIDGAFAQRNAGAKHWSEVARSGNGNMMTDLDETDTKDYEEIDGLGEHLECLSLVESTRVDGLGSAAAVAKFRWPAPGETPPFAAKPGMAWVRRKVLTSSRAPGGTRVAKVKWAQMSKDRIAQAVKTGDLPTPGVSGMGSLGLSMETTGISLGIGLVGGALLWFLIRRRKK